MIELVTMGNPDGMSKHDYAYQQIKEWIVQGVLVSDTILVERQLCEKLHLSRTPIRSALMELAQEGFLMSAPGRGMMVSRVQAEDIVEIFEIRMVLDPLALELFMRTAKAALIAEARLTVTKMQQAMDAGDSRAFAHADNHFHEIYSQNCGNHRLQKIWSDLEEHEHRILSLTINDMERMKMSYRHHCAIIEEIEKGNVQGAKDALLAHLKDSLDYHFQKTLRM